MCSAAVCLSVCLSVCSTLVVRSFAPEEDEELVCTSHLAATSSQAALCCAALRCAVLCCAVLCCAVLCVHLDTAGMLNVLLCLRQD